MNPPARRINNSMQWLWLCGLMSLLLAPAAKATDALWPPADQLGSLFYFSIPGNPPPTIDATAFDNENQFVINFSQISIFNGVINPEVYETWNTLNYTNNGLMLANNPLGTNGVFLLTAAGCGFNFDNQSSVSGPNYGFHLPADTFYNPGSIRVNSALDFDQNFLTFFTLGKFYATATNIINPGRVTVGEGGVMQFTGQNVDLTRSELHMEDLNTLINVLNNIYGNLSFFIPPNMVVLIGSVGHQTNEITPSVQFSLPNPTSDNFIPPLLGLKNATAYVRDTGIFGTTRFVNAVFISNPVANVTNNVYFSFGENVIEWAGSYINPATGKATTNYMYLDDFFGEITNLQVNFNNDPVGYSWYASQVPFPLGVAANPGLPIGTFDNNSVTNDFAYESVQFIASTVATNASLQNPSGALTNLQGRIQITATHDLDLTLAQIVGPNYMSLTATNNFKGSAGASIFSPYSDFNLGVTNGSMSVSNLLSPSVPNWNGPVQVFSARWVTVDALGFTNIYHVTLINSGAIPTTPPVVQDLILHSTNLFVSDVFNVIRKISIDATSLTVTTNQDTDGVGSQTGELNWYNPVPLNTVQLPNLHWLTNNGAIRAANAAFLGSSGNIYGAVINNGLLVSQGSTIYASNFLSSGTISNGAGSFVLQSQTSTITNGSLLAGGDVTITTGNLLTSNLYLTAGRSLTLQVTNLLTDTGPNPTNNSFWTVGGSGQTTLGFSLPLKPTVCDLLATTITNIAWTNKVIRNTWSGLDRGTTNSGYANNAALGRLVLDPIYKNPNTQIYFTGTGPSNAIYVDCLILLDQATNRDTFGNVSSLIFNTNLVIYYAQALQNGVSIAEKIDHANTNHLRWMPTYAGYYSSTNLVYPPGVTNTVNAALAISPNYDSDGDGTKNSQDSTPFLVPAQLGLNAAVTNRPPLSVQVQWFTVPAATNYVYYKTNLLSPSWSLLTNFASPLFPKQPAFPVSVFDVVTNTPHFYQVEVVPWLLRP